MFKNNGFVVVHGNKSKIAESHLFLIILARNLDKMKPNPIVVRF